MIELEDVGELRSPVVVAAFEGWSDAADASTAAVEHLETVFDAHVVGAVDPDLFYDFTVNRPSVTVTEEGERRIVWPTTRLSVASPPGSSRDVILVRGLEPNMRWRDFGGDLATALHDLGATLLITLGAMLSDEPHTRPVPVTGSAGDKSSAATLGLPVSRYQGTVGVLSTVQEACSSSGIAAVSFWAAVPHYVPQSPCPKATLALLRKVEDTLDIEVPLGDLDDRARAWEQQVDELAAADHEVAEYVRALESRKGPETLPDASGDAIAREFERYLRRRGLG